MNEKKLNAILDVTGWLVDNSYRHGVKVNQSTITWITRISKRVRAHGFHDEAHWIDEMREIIEDRRREQELLLA